MKSVIQVGFLTCAMLLATISFASVGHFEDIPTTCYLFKNTQLSKKSPCTYAGSSGGSAAPYMVFEANFTVKGYGKIGIVDNSFADGIDDKGNWINQTTTRTMNGKNAIHRIRDAKSYKILTDKQIKQRWANYEAIGQQKNWVNVPLPNWLSCYTTNKSAVEFCYNDNTPR